MFFAVLAAVVLYRTRTPWLRSSAKQIGGLVLLQVLLGAGAWATRFGFATVGYVAVARSPEQTWLRTTHTIVGMMLFAASVVAVSRVLRVASVATTVQTSDSVSRLAAAAQMSTPALSGSPS